MAKNQPSRSGTPRPRDESGADANHRRVIERKAVETLRRHQRRLLDHAGITSVGVGFRVRNGRKTDEVVIQCTVDRKVAPEELAAAGLSPLPQAVEAEDGTLIPIDVVQRNYRPSHRLQPPISAGAPENFRDTRRSYQDPMVPGLSVSHIDGTAGTIGAFVYDAATGEALLLSNWHVLDQGGTPGDTIVQPGPYDDPGTAGNECGALLRSHIGMAGDCAVARIAGRQFDRRILELDREPRRMADPELDDLVVKSGRTTGVTYGVVRRVDVVVKIDYGGATGVVEVGGFEIGPNPDKLPATGEVSQGGDSGSAWMLDVPADAPDADVIIGLHFAGETDPEPSAEHAIACKITSVAKKLAVAFEPPPGSVVDESALWREVLERLNRLEASARGGPCRCQAPAGPGSSAAIPEAGVPVHGNWCGPGHGGGTPVDALDEACKRHDECYGRRGYFDCDCDRTLTQEVDNLIARGRVRGTTLAKAFLVRSWFANAPCVRHLRVGGTTVPLPLPPLPGGGVPSPGDVGRAVGNAGRRLGRRLGF